MNHTDGVYEGPPIGLGVGSLPWDEPGQVVAIRWPTASAAADGLAFYRSVNTKPPLSHFANVSVVCNIMLDDSKQPENAAADGLYAQLRIRLRKDC